MILVFRERKQWVLYKIDAKVVFFLFWPNFLADLFFCRIIFLLAETKITTLCIRNATERMDRQKKKRKIASY